MNIQSISKTDKVAVVKLNADELVILGNALYLATKELGEDALHITSNGCENNPAAHQLYSEIMIARDLCQYGHIDDFCLEQVNKHRRKPPKTNNK